MLRIAAALAIGLGAATLLAYFHVIGKGPWATTAARHLRAMKERTAPPVSFDSLDFAAIPKLPSLRPLEEYAPLESRGVIVEGYVKGMIRSADGDYHLDLISSADLQHPDPPYAIAEVTPQWRRGSQRWSYESLSAALRATARGAWPWEPGPRRVRLSGWLLYDYQLEGGARAKPTSRTISAWEVHPVTRIELWDDDRAAYVEYPR